MPFPFGKNYTLLQVNEYFQFLFLIFIHLFVNGFITFPSGHFLSGLLNGFSGNLFIVLIFIHLFVNGFITFPSGHFLSGLLMVFLVIYL